jgi:predicted dehydrogenase
MQLKKLLKADILGKLFHFSGEAYGPVMLSRENSTWRSKREQGGGCLYDYAAHVINLLQEVVARPTKIHGALLKKTFSTEVEDAVYALLGLENGVTGTLLVNWSDDTYRKMSTSITVMGEKGKMVCDATELKIFLKEANREFGFEQGWTIKTIADLALPVNFYLRGEEYSAQIDYFVDCVKNNHRQEINTFEQSQFTNHVIDMIIQNSTEN